MANMRRRGPEPPPGPPQIEFKPGMADEMLRELGPLLAEEGIERVRIDLAREVGLREQCLQLRRERDALVGRRRGHELHAAELRTKVDGHVGDDQRRRTRAVRVAREAIPAVCLEERCVGHRNERHSDLRADLAETVEARSGAAMAKARTEGRSTGARGPRRIIDHLVVQGRHIWWTQLTEEGGWLLQVVDEAGEEIATAAHYDPVEALAAVAEFILPGHPG